MDIKLETAKCVQSLDAINSQVSNNSDDITSIDLLNNFTTGDAKKTLRVNLVEDGYDLVKQTVGALVMNSISQSVSSSTALVVFNSEVYDDAAIHDTVTLNTRLVVPAGYTKATLVSGLNFNINGLGIAELYFKKNGSTDFIGNVRGKVNNTTGTLQRGISIDTGPINCIGGDYFELEFYTNVSTCTLLADIGSAYGGSWFNCLFEA